MDRGFFSYFILSNFDDTIDDFCYYGHRYVKDNYIFDTLTEGYTFFGKCKMYQIRFDSFDNTAFVFTIKGDKLIIKCRKLFTKNDYFYKPINKYVEVDLPKPVPNPDNYSNSELIKGTYKRTDINNFYTFTLPTVIFRNYVFNDGSCLYDHYSAFYNARRKEEVERYESLNNIYKSTEKGNEEQTVKKSEEENVKLFGEEVF